MKLHILSDLHIEFLPFDPPAVDCDVVILAGDVGIGTRGIDWAAATFRDRPVLYISGNHESYGGNLSRVAQELRARALALPNVAFLDNDEVVIGDVRFLGTTLWTDFKLFGSGPAAFGRALREAKNSISDFIRNIRYGTGFFTPAQSVELHVAAVAWLQAKLAEPFPGKTVVITHHCPGWGSVAERFKTDWVTPAFASDLDRLMGPPVSAWIHGHTHTSFDYERNGTRVVCNPRGYCYRFKSPSEHGVRQTVKCENMDFNPGLVVEI
jgi:3',5'-cyclic AMP phosphodiesterase CpdA